MYMGLVGVDIGKESVCQCKRCKSRGFSPWVGKVPWSRKWQPTPEEPGRLQSIESQRVGHH